MVNEDHLEEIVRRRMKNTGEDYERAREAVVARMVELEDDRGKAPAGWDFVWMAEGPKPPSADDEEWLRGRPPSVKLLALQFPPSCIIEALPGRIMQIPPPGGRAVVIGYSEPLGHLVVKAHPGAVFYTYVDPNWVRVVGYHGGKTHDWAARVLGA